MIALAAALWLALPPVLWLFMGRLDRRWRPAALAMADALALGGIGLLCLAFLGPPPHAEPVTGGYFIWLNPGREVLQIRALQALALIPPLILTGFDRALRPRRLGLWLFGYLRVTLGLVTLPRLMWRLDWIEAGGRALQLELGGSQLEATLWPAAGLVLLLAGLSRMVKPRP